MDETICIRCGHRPHASPCLICVCGWPEDQWPMPEPDEQELAREAARQARVDEMRQPLQVRPEALEKLMRFKPLYPKSVCLTDFVILDDPQPAEQADA